MMTAPKHQPPSQALIARFKAYHAKHPAWGSLHVVLDDENIDDDFVEGCIAHAVRERDSEGEHLARELLKLSISQRHKLARDGYK